MKLTEILKIQFSAEKGMNFQLILKNNKKKMKTSHLFP